MQFSVLMQSLWCCKQILTKSVAQVHVNLSKGTLALREGTKVHIDVLPLGVLLVCQFLEVGEEISFYLLLIEEIVTLLTIASKRRQRIASALAVRLRLYFCSVWFFGLA